MKRRLLVILIAVAVAITFVPTLSFAAEKSKPIPKNIKTLYYPKLKSNWTMDGKNGGVLAFKSDWTFKMKKCKSSNKKIAKVKFDSSSDGMPPCYTVLINKKGKAKLTVYAKPTGSKKAYKKYVIKITAYEYINPAKSFKIGSRNFAGKFKKVDWCDYEGKNLTGKLSIKTKKGWQLKSISLGNYTDAQKFVEKEHLGKTVKIKNGSVITLTGETPELRVTYYNKKKKYDVTQVLDFFPVGN